MLSMHDLRKIVSSLHDKFSLYETLNCRIVKEVFEAIGYVVLNLINTSLNAGKIPNTLNISTDIPIQKVANTTKTEEFRPINTLPPLEMLIEIAVYDQLVHHASVNLILINNQSGFGKNTRVKQQYKLHYVILKLV